MKLTNVFFPPPFKARHYKRTFVASPDDEASRPTRELIECAAAAVLKTLDVDVSSVSDRMKGGHRWPDTWPGEHYRLLAGFVAHLQPRCVVEIGTFTGLSCLSLKQCLPAGSTLTTFDLIPWDDFPDTCLAKGDFGDGRLRQIIGDGADPAAFDRHAELFAAAELLFVDGPKDRVFEPAFAANLDRLPAGRPRWVLFDDIRDLNMLQFWRDIRHPKLDLSSFGHWTGTGLVLWGAGAGKPA